MNWRDYFRGEPEPKPRPSVEFDMDRTNAVTLDVTLGDGTHLLTINGHEFLINIDGDRVNVV